MKELIQKLIEEERIRTVFQPIFSLKDGSIIGYEALSRGPEDSELKDAAVLFTEAKRYNLLWNLERLSRKLAIQKATPLLKEKKMKLFLNVDPESLVTKEFQAGFTKTLLEQYQIKPEQICFEITERSAIFDFESFTLATENYKKQGYGIAIDDTGSGYSGLERITEVRPHFIKLDISLIRNIDKDPFKQALIKSFVNLSLNTNVQLIAEGIESKEELKMLIKLGVGYAQGFFLGRPSPYFTVADDSLTQYICVENQYNEKMLSFTDDYNYIGSLIQFEKPFLETTSCGELLQYMRSENYESVCIVNNEMPVGLVMQNRLLFHFAEQFGNSLYSKRPIVMLMDRAFLMVDYYEPIVSVSEKAMNRIPEKTYDSIVVTKNGRFEGLVSIKTLLNYTTNLEKKYARELNPLSDLPGNVIINRVLRDVITNERSYCLLYFDLDHFKIYNDIYGFENGDRILKFTAELIKRETKNRFPFDSFVGHIGGDDFLCVVEGDYEKCESLCEMVKRTFDEKITEFYHGKDAERGYLEGFGREGEYRKFPLTSISIAGYYGVLHHLKTPETLSTVMSDIKKEVKRIEGSAYIIEKEPYLLGERRGIGQ